MTTKIKSNNIDSTTLSSLGGGIKISSITFANNDTVSHISGGNTATITGSGFANGAIVFAGETSCVTTFTNTTSLLITTPAKDAGTYTLSVYNTDGSSGIKPAGIGFDVPPTWVTSSGALVGGTQDSAYSTNVSATGLTTITYSVTSGSLPTGITLNSSTGVISGTPTTAATSNFTITATNANNQGVSRAFSIVIVNTFAISYLAVGGGGSGGTGYYGGGGGAGGVLNDTSALLFGTSYTITIGSGGVGTSTQTNRGGSGGNTSISGTGFTTITAYGGGGGGSRNSDQGGVNGSSGSDGGSGGGASFPVSYGGKGVYPGSTFLSETRQGYDGASTPTGQYGNGGGGAGQIGHDTVNFANRNGGDGISSSITGTATYYGGGGAGALGSHSGGQGGGGSLSGGAGTVNTGGGGAGASPNNTAGGSGGSGVFIISYSDTKPAATTTGSPTVTASGGNRIYKFTGSGTFQVNN